MCCYTLPDSGVHIFHTSVQPFSDKDMRNPDIQKRLKSFDDKIAANIANNETLVDAEDTPEGCYLGDTADIENPYLPYKPDAEMLEVDDYTKDALENYLISQVLLPDG